MQAVDYRHGEHECKIDFRGTALMPDASGKAKVKSNAGSTKIDAEFKDLRNADYYGPQFLTYVLWAITPDGRPVNLGEIVPNDKHKVSIHVTAPLQTFGMIVTAEPYFAVTRPSDVTVLENEVTSKTKGWVQPVSAHYQATEKGEYTVDISSNQLPASTMSLEERKQMPLALLEALNAVAIAKATGAQQYAPEVLARARQSLDRGKDYFQRKQSDSAIATVARSATQAAEDARLLSIRKKRKSRWPPRRRPLNCSIDTAQNAREQTFRRSVSSKPNRSVRRPSRPRPRHCRQCSKPRPPNKRLSSSNRR